MCIRDSNKDSQISKALVSTSPEVLAKRFVGGKFFTVNNQLVDFRDNTYTGFVHSNQSIEKLINIIGVTQKSNRNSKFTLENVRESKTIKIEQYKEGGEFESVLHFRWSPFSQTISSSFELVRLICANGMVAVNNFFNGKIPLINRWDEHINIACKQIHNAIQVKVHQRIVEMGKERATVGELLRISKHGQERIQQSQTKSPEQINRLRNIITIADPKRYLSCYYKQSVFEQPRLANTLPGHLTTFDAWNLVTELSSHTDEVSTSTNIALQRLANSLMFDDESRKQRINVFTGKYKPLSAFSDPTAAFFGEMS